MFLRFFFFVLLLFAFGFQNSNYINIGRDLHPYFPFYILCSEILLIYVVVHVCRYFPYHVRLRHDVYELPSTANFPHNFFSPIIFLGSSYTRNQEVIMEQMLVCIPFTALIFGAPIRSYYPEFPATNMLPSVINKLILSQILVVNVEKNQQYKCETAYFSFFSYLYTFSELCE